MGLGLIGGSLAAASRKAFPHARIIGVSRSRRALIKAKKEGWIHEGFQNLRQALRESKINLPHLVVVCTPVDTLKDFLARIDRFAPAGTFVTDAGSVKGFLVRWAGKRKWRHIQFVGAHPMAGSHKQGIDFAQPDLFKQALTFVTPARHSSLTAVREVTNFWKEISKRAVILSPDEHDRLTAQVSHLPHLLAALLVTGTSAKALGFAASGFLDATRIAKADPGLWVSIFLENRKELYRLLENFTKELGRIQKIFKSGDRRRLKQLLTQAQRYRAILDKGSLGGHQRI